MSNQIQSKLNEAFAHVESGRLDDALKVIKPIVDSVPENADAWWIYSYAVTDPREAYRALNNVKRIAPDYAGVDEMMLNFNNQYPGIVDELSGDPISTPRIDIKPVLPPSSMPEVPTSRPEPQLAENVPQYTRSLDKSDPVVNESNPRRSSFPLIAFIAALVIIGLVAVLLLINNPTSTVLPVVTLGTSVVENSANTEIPSGIAGIDGTPTVDGVTGVIEVTPEVTIVETSSVISSTDVPLAAEATEVVATLESLPLPEATQDVTQTAEIEPNVTAEATTSEQSLTEALSQFTLSSEGTLEVETDFGMTFIAEVCSAPGRELRTLMPLVMEALARNNAQLTESTEALGVRMVNCDDQSVFLAVATTLGAAQSFADGSLDSAAFAATWRPIG